MERQEYTQLLAELLGQFSTFGGVVTVDSLGIAPGSVGLYPVGQEERQLRRDILGNTQCRITRNFLLRYRAVPGPEAVARLEAFTQWAKNYQIDTGKGRLTDPGKGGSGIYEMALTVTETVSR